MADQSKSACASFANASQVFLNRILPWQLPGAEKLSASMCQRAESAGAKRIFPNSEPPPTVWPRPCTTSMKKNSWQISNN